MRRTLVVLSGPVGSFRRAVTSAELVAGAVVMTQGLAPGTVRHIGQPAADAHLREGPNVCR